MSLLFRSIDQDKIVIQYLPPGRIYKKAGLILTTLASLLDLVVISVMITLSYVVMVSDNSLCGTSEISATGADL
jgi:hypothetical protein